MTELNIFRSGAISIVLIAWFYIINKCLDMISQPSDTRMFAGIGLLFGSILTLIVAVKAVIRLTK